MGNINMDYIAQGIYKYYEDNNEDWKRDHLGGSLIGHECQRAIWLSFRWAIKPEFSGRILRLFQTGQREEERIVYNLQSIGLEIYDKDPDTWKQIRVKLNEHCGGSIDAIGRGFKEAKDKWHILEFKTHNDKSFKDLLKNGVKVSKPQHYAQMTFYTGLMQKERAYYIAVNKNTDEIYSERIKLDNKFFKQLCLKADAIIDSKTLPVGISDNPEFYKCKWCDYYKFCHGSKPVEKNCRTCKYSSPLPQGGWGCEIIGLLTPEKQREGCSKWEVVL